MDPLFAATWLFPYIYFPATNIFVNKKGAPKQPPSFASAYSMAAESGSGVGLV